MNFLDAVKMMRLGYKVCNPDFLYTYLFIKDNKIRMVTCNQETPFLTGSDEEILSIRYEVYFEN